MQYDLSELLKTEFVKQVYEFFNICVRKNEKA